MGYFYLINCGDFIHTLSCCSLHVTFYGNRDNIVDCIQCKVGVMYFVFDGWSTTEYLRKMWYHRGQDIHWHYLCLTMVVLESNAEQCLHTAPELHWALILLNITVGSFAIRVWHSKTNVFNTLPCQGVAFLIPLQLYALWEKKFM